MEATTTAVDIDTLTDEQFKALPLVIKGESKEVRYAGKGMVVIRFLPTIYSFTQNRCAEVPGSDVLRLRADAIFVQLLEANGVKHAYQRINDRFAYSRLILPDAAEFAKYALPEFTPPDLSPEERAALPRAPSVEVIVKCFHAGTSKFRYRGLHGSTVRASCSHFAGILLRIDEPYPETIVRFDWRNALTERNDPLLRKADAGAVALCSGWLDELRSRKEDIANEAEFRRIEEFLTTTIDPGSTRLPDEILPEALANCLIDVRRARQTALNVYHVMQIFLDSCDIVCYDLCLFISEDGQTVYGEISQDCGRFRHFDLGSLDKDVWRAGGSSTEVLAKWQKFSELLEAGWLKAQTHPLLYAVPRLTDEPVVLHLGTTNPYKISEIAAMTQHLNIVLTPMELDVEEPYATFAENARTKALAYAASTGGLTLAEDSGLAVDALGGLPGPWSARFADHCTIDISKGVHGGLGSYVASGRRRDRLDEANNLKVLELMRGKTDRGAGLHVAFCVAQPGQVLFETETSSRGFLADAPKGQNGFGYDPIFIGNDTFGATWAELDPCRKNLRSFRRKACKELAKWIAQELRSDTAGRTRRESADSGCTVG